MVTHLKYRYIDLHLLDCIRTTLRLIQMNVTDYKILFVHACAPKVWKFIPASCSFPSTQLTLTLLPHLPDYHSLGSGGNPSPFLPILVRSWRNKWKETEIQRAFSLVFPRDKLGFFSGVFPSLLPAKLMLTPSMNPQRKRKSTEESIHALAILQLIL